MLYKAVTNSLRKRHRFFMCLICSTWGRRVKQLYKKILKLVLFLYNLNLWNLFQKSLFISNFRTRGLLHETILFKKNYIFSLLSATILVWWYDNANVVFYKDWSLWSVNLSSTGFRIQFNDSLNYIIDINKNKNPHPLVEIDTINDFVSMGFTIFLLLMKLHVFQTCKKKTNRNKMNLLSFTCTCN